MWLNQRKTLKKTPSLYAYIFFFINLLILLKATRAYMQIFKVLKKLKKGNRLYITIKQSVWGHKVELARVVQLFFFGSIYYILERG